MWTAPQDESAVDQGVQDIGDEDDISPAEGADWTPRSASDAAGAVSLHVVGPVCGFRVMM